MGTDPSFLSAGPTGIISCYSNTRINHVVLLTGYNTTHWFVKNSWGTGWGNFGYGYISKNVMSDCGIRQYVTEMQVDFGFLPNPDANNIVLTVTVMILLGMVGTATCSRSDKTAKSSPH